MPKWGDPAAKTNVFRKLVPVDVVVLLSSLVSFVDGDHRNLSNPRHWWILDVSTNDQILSLPMMYCMSPATFSRNILRYIKMIDETEMSSFLTEENLYTIYS
jgi:hypothetical protein